MRPKGSSLVSSMVTDDPSSATEIAAGLERSVPPLLPAMTLTASDAAWARSITVSPVARYRSRSIPDAAAIAAAAAIATNSWRSPIALQSSADMAPTINTHRENPKNQIGADPFSEFKGGSGRCRPARSEPRRP